MVELLSGKLSPDQDAVTAAKAALTAELPRILGEPKDAFLVAATPTAADFALFPLAAILRRVVKRKPDAGLDEVLALIEPNWFQRMDMLPILLQTWPPHWFTGPSSNLEVTLDDSARDCSKDLRGCWSGSGKWGCICPAHGG